MTQKSKILLVVSLLLPALFLGFVRESDAEACGNRDIIGFKDIFWGNPPPINIDEPSPRKYNDVNVGPGDVVRLSVEGEFPDFGPGLPDCSGLGAEFEIYSNVNQSTPIAVISGTLTSGTQIQAGNFGTWQWYVPWSNNLFDGVYKFRLIKLGGTPIDSVLSTNRLIVTGAGSPPLNLGNWWCEKEDDGDWTGIWIRRSSTNLFDASWVKTGESNVTAVLTMSVNGSNVFIQRRNSSDGNNCDYTGSSPDSINVSGRYGPCTKNAGGSWSAVINGTCYSPPTATISCNGSNPCTIPYNSSANIVWSSTGSTGCTVSPSGWTGTSGSRSTGNLTSSATYSIVCTSNVNSSASSSVTVNVMASPPPPPPPQPPTVSINCNNSNPCSIAYNSSATINWSSTNATSCSISPSGWTGVSGSQNTGNLTSSANYSISCSGADGSASGSVSVVVAVPPPPPPTSPPPPPDSDGDGVIDSVDQCPGTPAGTLVDSVGCPFPPPQPQEYEPFDKWLKIPNPFSGEIDTFDDLLNTVINFFYYIAGPIIVIMIIFSGLMFLFGRGQPDKVNTAKRILLWAVVGLVIILIGQGFVELLRSIIALGN